MLTLTFLLYNPEFGCWYPLSVRDSVRIRSNEMMHEKVLCKLWASVQASGIIQPLKQENSWCWCFRQRGSRPLDYYQNVEKRTWCCIPGLPAWIAAAHLSLSYFSSYLYYTFTLFYPMDMIVLPICWCGNRLRTRIMQLARSRTREWIQVLSLVVHGAP